MKYILINTWLGLAVLPTVAQPRPTPTVTTAFYQPAEAFRQALLRSVRYPQLARELGIEGIVWVRVRLYPNGALKTAHIIDAASPVLARAVWQAMQQALQTQFIVASEQPVRHRCIDYPIRFELE